MVNLQPAMTSSGNLEHWLEQLRMHIEGGTSREDLLDTIPVLLGSGVCSRCLCGVNQDVSQNFGFSELGTKDPLVKDSVGSLLMGICYLALTKRPSWIGPQIRKRLFQQRKRERPYLKIIFVHFSKPKCPKRQAIKALECTKGAGQGWSSVQAA